MPAPYASSPEDLALHAPRVLGLAPVERIAERTGLAPGGALELLLDHEARGWVRSASFAGTGGWYVTDAGRVEDERRMAAELDRAGAREAVTAVHQRFRPLNRRLGEACTAWQLRPTAQDRLAANDHGDPAWDAAVLRELRQLDAGLRVLGEELAARLQRFAGYADRFSAALQLVEAGQHAWLDAPGTDSCHTVWVQFHEDLLSTLGLPRGSDA